ncbi:hypothetical protein H4F63_13995 [Pectobacterium brasiliense]|nr:hypothetical protein [Pectobacterium brasiliense]MBN3128582.1 hypothetical protein [Pectobacterium brasiliense]
MNVSELSIREKGEMLYNHLWHSNLEKKYLSHIFENKNYWSIIKHKNFNPRLIEFITSHKRIQNIDASEYWEYILDVLDNPKEIWSFYFKKQLSKEQLFITCLVVFNGGVITEKEIKESYDKLMKKT